MIDSLCPTALDENGAVVLGEDGKPVRRYPNEFSDDVFADVMITLNELVDLSSPQSSLFYPPFLNRFVSIRNEMLSSYNWRFAINNGYALPPVDKCLSKQYRFAYTLPPDFLRCVDVFRAGNLQSAPGMNFGDVGGDVYADTSTPRMDSAVYVSIGHNISNGLLYTNHGPWSVDAKADQSVYLDYISLDVLDEDTPSYFIEVLIMRLASTLAPIVIKGDQGFSERGRCAQMLAQSLSNALAINSSLAAEFSPFDRRDYGAATNLSV